VKQIKSNGKERDADFSRNLASFKKNSGKERQRALDLSSLQQLEKGIRGLPIPPRKSSLSLRDRRTVSSPGSRKFSNASSAGTAPGLLESPMPLERRGTDTKVNGIMNTASRSSSYREIARSENEHELLPEDSFENVGRQAIRAGVEA